MLDASPAAATPAPRPSVRRYKELLTRHAQRLNLRPSRLAVLLALIRLWDPERPLYPRVATIARGNGRVLGANVAPSTVHTCLAELREIGALTWEHRRDPQHGHNRSSEYWFPEAFFAAAGLPPIPAVHSENWSLRTPKKRDKKGPSSLLIPSSDLDRSSYRNGEKREHSPRPSLEEVPEYEDLRAAVAAAHYDPDAVGTIRRDQRPAVAAELRSLAARAVAVAVARSRYDYTPEMARRELCARIAHLYITLDRPWLREHKHPLGGLWNPRGPCDLVVLGAAALDAWCGALEDGYSDLPPPAPPPPAPPPPAPPPAPPPPALAAEDAPEEIRRACEELRAALDVPAAPPPRRPAAPPPRDSHTAECRARALEALRRLEAEEAEKRRSRPAKARGGRAPIGTRPRARAALLAALAHVPEDCPAAEDNPTTRTAPDRRRTPPRRRRFRGRWQTNRRC